jgi:hypothetical protein
LTRPLKSRRAVLCPTALAVLAPSWLSGCASWSARQTADVERAHAQGGKAPAQVDLARVPYFAQAPFHCGPAALATVLVDLGLRDVTPETLAEGVFLPSRQGSLQLEMLSAARRTRAVPTQLPSQLQALLVELQAGTPVVVLLNLGLSWVPAWHYAVAVGYDVRSAPQMILRSGDVRRDVMPMATFEHVWARASHWAVVVKRPGQWPASATVEAMEAAAVGFERAANDDDALAVYSSLIQQFPQRWLPRAGRGNVHMRNTAATSARAAAVDYREALQRLGQSEPSAPRDDRASQPTEVQLDRLASLWNNLAQALMRSGDRPQAVEASAQAMKFSAGRETVVTKAVRSTWAELSP